MVVRTETGQALPSDTRINVRYGGNPDGEPYALGESRTPQAVSCSEDTAGAPSVDDSVSAAGAGGAPAMGGGAVYALRCGLYTQGPARVDVTATGYEPVEDEALSFDRKRHCEVPIELKLIPAPPDAGP
ncbi:MAG: hypothetical protein ABUL60_10925 [Myxococcales bacterium]